MKADNDIAPFENILNNMYSRDLSRKIKSAIKQRVSHGLYFSGQKPYGYKKDPNNKNRIVPDAEAAENVKGMTERQILSPSAYKAKHGDTRFMFYNKGKEKLLTKRSISAVDKIMKDRVYCGDLVGCKSEVPQVQRTIGLLNVGLQIICPLKAILIRKFLQMGR